MQKCKTTVELLKSILKTESNANTNSFRSFKLLPLKIKGTCTCIIHKKKKISSKAKGYYKDKSIVIYRF